MSADDLYCSARCDLLYKSEDFALTKEYRLTQRFLVEAPTNDREHRQGRKRRSHFSNEDISQYDDKSSKLQKSLSSHEIDPAYPFTILAAVSPICSGAQAPRPDHMVFLNNTFGHASRNAANTMPTPTQPPWREVQKGEVQKGEVLRTSIHNDSADDHNQSSQIEPTTMVFKKYVTLLLPVYRITVARADFRLAHVST